MQFDLVLVMMSHMLCHFLVLVFLTSRSTTLGKPADSVLECGEDKCCEILEQLMSTVNEMKNKLDEKLDKQAKDLEELKTDMNKSLATISTQLGRHSTDLLSHDGRLRAHDVSQRNEYQLVQSKCTRRIGDHFLAHIL